MIRLGFWLYIVFVLSWFLHLPARIPFLGIIRFDLIMIAAVLAVSVLAGNEEENHDRDSSVKKMLMVLICYSILTLPFVEWPGSVFRRGFPNFVKAAIFYFFTVKFIETDRQLKAFIGVFLAVQSFRIIEPVYLHITTGYWGSYASMAGGRFMNRLSGSPYDIVNPNGLAFIIDTVIPFFYYFFSFNLASAVICSAMMFVSIYALVLTGSRSGFLGLLIMLVIIVYKSKRKLILASAIALFGFFVFININPDLKDRYLSIIDKNTANIVTAKGRVEGIKKYFLVALRKPIFGHGLGTSREANANFAGNDQPAHNLYAEVAQELGFVGLIIFLLYIKEVIKTVIYLWSEVRGTIKDSGIIKRIVESLQVWFGMNLLFSLASYGLSSYEWYLFPGLFIAAYKIVRHDRLEK